MADLKHPAIAHLDALLATAAVLVSLRVRPWWQRAGGAWRLYRSHRHLGIASKAAAHLALLTILPRRFWAGGAD